jgi:hypothetical protein
LWSAFYPCFFVGRKLTFATLFLSFFFSRFIFFTTIPKVSLKQYFCFKPLNREPVDLERRGLLELCGSKHPEWKGECHKSMVDIKGEERAGWTPTVYRKGLAHVFGFGS